MLINMNVPNHSPGYDGTASMRQDTTNISTYFIISSPTIPMTQTQRMLILFPATFNLFVVSRYTPPSYLSPTSVEWWWWWSSLPYRAIIIVKCIDLHLTT